MNPQCTESHDTLPARLLEMWDALDPVDAWRPPLKEAADEIERLRAQVAQQAAEVQRLRADAERWRYWRNYWPALCRMEVARFARLDLRMAYVQGPAAMDEVTDAAIRAARQDGAGEQAP